MVCGQSSGRSVGREEESGTRQVAQATFSKELWGTHSSNLPHVVAVISWQFKITFLTPHPPVDPSYVLSHSGCYVLV